MPLKGSLKLLKSINVFLVIPKINLVFIVNKFSHLVHNIIAEVITVDYNCK